MRHGLSGCKIHVLTFEVALKGTWGSQSREGCDHCWLLLWRKKAGDTERKEKGQRAEKKKAIPEGEKTGPVNLDAVERKGLRGVAIAALLSGLTHRCYQQGDEPHPISFLYSCLVHLNKVNFDPSRRI